MHVDRRPDRPALGSGILETVAGTERHVNPWIIAISVMFCTFMEVLDTTVVNVSLPHIGGNLSASIDEVTWVLTSYLVANAIVLPITGWLSNYPGTKAAVDAFGIRVYARFLPVRRGSNAGIADSVSGDSGRVRRGAAAAFASRAARSVSTGGTGKGDGVLGARNRGCAGSGSCVRRLADG